MTKWNTEDLAAADKRYLWHPFTSTHDWCAPEHEPLVLVKGNGVLLCDSRGHEYIDGNSSIWTNVHGHNHPHINAAIRRQLDLVAHTSFLGFTNPPAIELARAIVRLFPPDTLTRVFYSDDGSTGIEVALRIAAQYWQLQGSPRDRFIAFRDAYHGDTAGAASLGALAMFRQGASNWKFPALSISDVAALEALSRAEANRIAAVVIEPMVQGAAGIRPWPPGTLTAVRNWCDRAGALLVADEVLTGFGRTGRMFGCQHENILPDMMVLAKALTGGYLPLAITLVTEQLFAAFSDVSRDDRTLYYGHSYTGNALACAAALASLQVFEQEKVLEALPGKIELLRHSLNGIRQNPRVLEVRQCGFIAGIELKEERDIKVGAAVCLAARRYGLLTRPIRNVIVLMPPFCISNAQLDQAVQAIVSAITDVCGSEAA